MYIIYLPIYIAGGQVEDGVPSSGDKFSHQRPQYSITDKTPMQAASIVAVKWVNHLKVHHLKVPLRWLHIVELKSFSGLFGRKCVTSKWEVDDLMKVL